ncbi:MAG: CBS domain-containing protein [Polaromonas sp.]|uniref:CBS domain-containing protein n=1 Tax=Polaromonas sp. TaxID=1869339 RepID=UPI0025F14723|nr:CBS domain-containing protein [Polaromonas sp.]MBI2725461.1 CBS domain-containing protein [Polaromonas sp.]
MTTVNKVMTADVRSLTPADSIATAAQAMSELNVGVIPVCDAGKLLGMVTDRDIVIRAVAKGMDGQAPLSGIMSKQVQTALPEDKLEDVLKRMSGSQVRRMPVVDSAGALVGIISLGDIAVNGSEDEAEVGESLGAISAP